MWTISSILHCGHSIAFVYRSLMFLKHNGTFNDGDLWCVIKALTTNCFCHYNSIMCSSLQYAGLHSNKKRVYSVWGRKQRMSSVAPFTRQTMSLSSHFLPDDISVDGLLLDKIGWHRIGFVIRERKQTVPCLNATNVFVAQGFSI